MVSIKRYAFTLNQIKSTVFYDRYSQLGFSFQNFSILILNEFFVSAKRFVVPQFIRRSNSKQRYVLIKGERYVRASKSNTSIYYKCCKFRKDCKARAVQKMNSNVLYVTNGEHNHPLGETW